MFSDVLFGVWFVTVSLLFTSCCVQSRRSFVAAKAYSQLRLLEVLPAKLARLRWSCSRWIWAMTAVETH